MLLTLRKLQRHNIVNPALEYTVRTQYIVITIPVLLDTNSTHTTHVCDCLYLLMCLDGLLRTDELLWAERGQMSTSGMSVRMFASTLPLGGVGLV